MPAQRIYLDHAATTPLRPEAKAAMDEGFAMWANPSSPHAEGRKAKAALEDARTRCKAALGWDGELIFTSGASEAAALAYEQVQAIHTAISAIEHDALHRYVGEGEAKIPLGEDGEVDLSLVARACEPSAKLETGGENRTLVAVQHVNSETGTIQDIAKVAQAVHGADGLLLVDCAQSAGKYPIPDGADMAIVAAHKFGGPIGIGALLVRDYAMLKPTGGHERGYRRGTENLPAIMGMVAALECGGIESWATTVEQQFDFKNALYAGGEVLMPGLQASHIYSVAHPRLSAQALLIRLDAMGFAVSAGSACSSGTLKKSRVLDAFGVPDDVASRTIRVSLGWNTTAEELDAFAAAWKSLT
ncbi:cysteine desulfurase family protein [Aurantiacibacter zhengii]|uniref:Cysteine desulfurase n=1 Tax=Aurantiacibacter zhengii TaxID=2307003 RepID=A0A418NUM3_9SPHN|nr:aminotransferase class V-fold PLP-dependent enzyme [Aurantiacibacter zhengii]RIV87595.1 aminotransferase class V-fold PLP-dependent enzyme [Aurantiacibacter zhengii]